MFQQNGLLKILKLSKGNISLKEVFFNSEFSFVKAKDKITNDFEGCGL